MMLGRAALASFLSLAALVPAGAARADVAPEVELVAGTSRNLGGRDLQEYFDQSYLLGLRGVVYLGRPGDSRFRLGVELAGDVRHYDWVPEGDVGAGTSDPDALRERFLAGARLEWRLSRFRIVGRALVGVDHYATDGLAYPVPASIVVPPLVASGSALAAEVGTGARVTIGHLVLGLQCDLPVAFYSTETPGSRAVYGPSESFIVPGMPDHWMRGTVVDVEGLATVGVAF
jgi:hypothetical protein